MRARNIKPGFFKNEILAELSLDARLLFIGLWCYADREGFFEYRPKRIKAEIFPYESRNVEKLLEELHTARYIDFYYENATEKPETPFFCRVVNFTKHQHPHKNEKPSDIKSLVDSQEFTGVVSDKHHSAPADIRNEDKGKRKTEATRVADFIIDYLNSQTGKKFQHSESSRSPIIARLRDGATADDCKTVIDNKVADPDFDRKYLQPSTLFRPSNFENYLNQTPSLCGVGSDESPDYMQGVDA